MATASSGSTRKPKRSPRRPRVSVLRIGHRPGRDPRLTTHVALAARALGAERMYLHPPDTAVEQTVRGVVARWGGSFEVVPVTNWRRLLCDPPGAVVHLTMYGLELERVLPRLRRAGPLLLVVGGAKVPSEVYRLARFNVQVSDQPHSEVAALAVALERLVGMPRPGSARGAELSIVPSARGKRIAVRRGRMT